MDHTSAGGATQENIGARRRRMRADARARRAGSGSAPEQFETPAWLEQSFVLPLEDQEVSAVPNQSVPHHDDPSTGGRGEPQSVDPEEAAMTAVPGFQRPATPEIDFARVIRRSDVSRRASRVALYSGGFAALALMVFLIFGTTAAVVTATVLGVVTLVSVGVRLRMRTAPIPHVQD